MIVIHIGMLQAVVLCYENEILTCFVCFWCDVEFSCFAGLVLGVGFSEISQWVCASAYMLG